MKNLFALATAILLAVTLTARGEEEIASLPTPEPSQSTATSSSGSSSGGNGVNLWKYWDEDQAEEEGPDSKSTAQKSKAPIWDRTRADLMDSIEYDMAGQLIYDNIFAIQEIPGDSGETLYSVVMDASNTGTGFAFLTDPNTGRNNLTLIAVDYTKTADLKAFCIGAAAMLLEGDVDGEYSSIRDAYNAFETMLDQASGSVFQKSVGGAIYTLSVSGNTAVFSAKEG